MSKRVSTAQAAVAPLDEDLEAWSSSSGFGGVEKSIPAGSSGWASFRKVTVKDPPTNDNDEPVSFFVKSSSRSCEDMFYGEALGLEAMYECSQGGEDTLRIPKVYKYGDYSTGKGSFLVMEYLNLAGRSDDRALGKAMASMHLAPATKDAGNPDKAFGFPVDNTMCVNSCYFAWLGDIIFAILFVHSYLHSFFAHRGGTPQPNPWTKPNSGTKEWVEFFRDHRIGHQLDLAGDPYCSNLWNNDIAPRLHRLFEDLEGEKEIKPSLLHGDLWSGNIGSADAKPSIFDPAVYWGHHEAEWGVSDCCDMTVSSWPV